MTKLIKPSRVYIVGNVAFVRHPAARGVWIMTHPCVADRDCDYCKSTAGIPCVGRHGYTGSTHTLRRKAKPRAPVMSVVTP